MKINEMIRTRRKEMNLTQEQVASRLGVSAPAVHKWETGSSYPDITLLPALARLLGTDLNTLLSFQEDLSRQEVDQFCADLCQMIEAKGFAAGFEAAMDRTAQYPNCDALAYLAAATLEGYLHLLSSEDAGPYLGRIEELYERASHSDDRTIRGLARAMVISKSVSRGEYAKAQELLDEDKEVPKSSFNHVFLQSNLYIRQDKVLEASQLLERELLGSAGNIQSTLLMMLDIALKEQDMHAASYIAQVSEQTAHLYDLWSYNSYVAGFQLAVSEKDESKTLEFLQKLLEASQASWDISASPLYRHLQENGGTFLKDHLPSSLADSMKIDECLAFLHGNPKFWDLVKKYAQD